MVTVPLSVAVLLTLILVVAFTARRRRRMTSSPLPFPVGSECRCGGADHPGWAMRCGGGCRSVQVAGTTLLNDDHHKSIQHHQLHQQHQLLDATSPNSRHIDVRHLAVVAPTSPSLLDDRPLKPTSSHSESTLLLVARDAWTS